MTSRPTYSELEAQLAAAQARIAELERGQQMGDAAFPQREGALLATVPDLVFIMDRQGVILDCKADLNDLYVQPRAAIIGRRCRDTLPPPVAARIEGAITAALRSGAVQQFEYQLEIPGRGWRDYEARLAPSGPDEVLAVVHDATERKLVEQGLQASEARLSQLFHASPVATSLTQVSSGKLVAINQAYTTLTGYSADEAIGHKTIDLGILAPADRAARVQLLQEGPLRNVETQVRCKSGAAKTCLLSLEVIDVAGEEHLLSSWLDITQRKQAEQELLELNRTLEVRVAERAAEAQDLYDNAPVAYFTLDAQGHYTGVNQTGLNLLGYSREELIGRSAVDFLSAASGAAAPPDLPRLVEQHSLNNLEYEVVRKDGSTLPVLVHTLVVYGADGSFQSLRATAFDISERKRTEAQLALQARLLTRIGQAIIVVDLAGRITFWNDAAATIYGWLPEEVLGRPLQDVIVPEPLQQQAESILATLALGQEWAGEFVVRRRDGSTFWALVHDTPVFDAAGQLLYIIGVSSDISERKRTEEAALRAAQEMARALRLRDEFLANMSHELRTPLNSILTLSEVLAADVYGPLNQRQLSAVGNIESSGRHLLALINDVLDLSKLEAEQLKLEKGPVNLDDACRASLAFTKELAFKKRIAVGYNVAMPAPVIQADGRRLKQMIVNLLSNAVKFTPEGGAIELSVTTDAVLQEVQIAVSDNGVGIAAENLPKLFRPFTQLDSSLSRAHEGAGLGLALVRNLAVQHGGSVTVESAGTPGQGSCFTLHLPYQPEAGAAPGASGEQGDAAVAAPRVRLTGDCKVLLADDNQVTAGVLTSYLEARGYVLAVAGDGVEALSLAQSVRPDLILMDIQMPHLDGIEAIRRLRADAAFAGTPIIAVTALAMAGDRERCLAAGANEYMSKPLSLRTLETVMARLLQRG